METIRRIEKFEFFSFVQRVYRYQIMHSVCFAVIDQCISRLEFKAVLFFLRFLQETLEIQEVLGDKMTMFIWMTSSS